ncbi:MAG TPA: fatty acid desaturase [Acidimicrobiaceae bacterium]|jgi:fatty acid desaturase|nr:fatty acid desaturase [Acidimicrobiaceae bacterium]HCV35877.1 fatty acid desaturase [Acidimicrobiaceae bacterium]
MFRIMSDTAVQGSLRDEWPTLVVATALYTSWLAIVVWHEVLPWPATLLLLAIVIAWHGSLQHELLHGHPFAKQHVNEAIGSIPLSLRLPFRVYQRSHLDHHACGDLTDPTTDTESFFVTAATWERLPAPGRWFLLAHHTLLGRMLLGPIMENVSVARRDITAIRDGDHPLLHWWIVHLVTAGAVLWLVVAVAGVPVWIYLLAVYVGNSLALVRSYCEHQWVEGDATRSVMVRSGWIFSVLFMNVNLHHTHHEQAGVPWFDLPDLADRLGSDDLAAVGAGFYTGYGEIFRHHLLHPFDHPVHPLERAST